MDWIMECNETVESAWSDAESAAKAKGEDFERNYTHCEYDDVQTNFIYSQVRSRREVLELVFFLLLLSLLLLLLSLLSLFLFLLLLLLLILVVGICCCFDVGWSFSHLLFQNFLTTT